MRSYRTNIRTMLLTFLLFLLEKLALVTSSPHPILDAKPHHPIAVNCISKDAECLSDGKLRHLEGCFDPLERGPCPPGHWIVAVVLESNPGVLTSKCAPQPCAADQVLYEGQCMRNSDAATRLCRGSRVHVDPTGVLRCGERPSWKELLVDYFKCVDPMIDDVPTSTTPIRPSKLPAPMTTELVPITTTMLAFEVHALPCVSTNEDECVNEVVSAQPTIALVPEK